MPRTSTRIPKNRSYVKFFSNRELGYFRRKYGYKKSTINSKTTKISKRMAKNAYEYAVYMTAKRNAGYIAQRLNISQKQLERGRVSQEAWELARGFTPSPSFVFQEISTTYFYDSSEVPVFAWYTYGKKYEVNLGIYFRVERKRKKRGRYWIDEFYFVKNTGFFYMRSLKHAEDIWQVLQDSVPFDNYKGFVEIIHYFVSGKL